MEIYQIRAVVEGGRATADDPRFILVGMDRYLAAGGRVSSDLFGELPDAVLDPESLQAAWRERVQPMIDYLKAEGLALYDEVLDAAGEQNMEVAFDASMIDFGYVEDRLRPGVKP